MRVVAARTSEQVERVAQEIGGLALASEAQHVDGVRGVQDPNARTDKDSPPTRPRPPP